MYLTGTPAPTSPRRTGVREEEEPHRRRTEEAVGARLRVREVRGDMKRCGAGAWRRLAASACGVGAWEEEARRWSSGERRARRAAA
jgi:hypothetical protein